MKLLEIKGEIVTINININAIRKFNKNKPRSKIDYGDYNEFLIEKLLNGNKDAIVKSIDVIKEIMVENGCSTYEQLFERSNV